MADIAFNTGDLVNPKYFGISICLYMSLADNLYELKFSEMPKTLQLYYNYLDVNERSEFIATADKDTGIVLADWHGDRSILDSGRLVTAPYFYRDDNVWLDHQGESMRFMMDLEENLTGEAE